MTKEEYRSLNEDLMKMESFDSIAKRELELVKEYENSIDKETLRKIRRDAVEKWNKLGLIDHWSTNYYDQARGVTGAGQKYMKEAMEKLPDFFKNNTGFGSTGMLWKQNEQTQQPKGEQRFNELDPYGEENW